MVKEVNGAIVFTTGMEIDADGSPHAYHPGGGGLDALGNAGAPGNWYGLACNAAGEPFVQEATDPAPGYYVSTTACVDHGKAASDPRRYVDSENVAYISVPPELRHQGVKMGDLCMIVHVAKDGTASRCAAIVADIGPHGKYGEGSICLAMNLGIPESPRHGGTDSGVTYIIFADSGSGWPNLAYAAAAEQLYQAWGGDETLNGPQS